MREPGFFSLPDSNKKIRDLGNEAQSQKNWFCWRTLIEFVCTDLLTL